MPYAPICGPMGSEQRMPEPRRISAYVEDGARIVAILLVWGIIAAFFAYGVGSLAGQGGVIGTAMTQTGGLFLLAGVLNAVLYLAYRTVDYWHHVA